MCLTSLDSGDRTPKQKVKLKVTEEKLLNLMLKYNGGKPRAEVRGSGFSIFIFVLPTVIFLCYANFSLFADKTKKCCPTARSIGCHKNVSSSYKVAFCLFPLKLFCFD